MSKRPILVLYDYGMGGTWAFVLAESEDQIRKRYPELEVVMERPAWMGDAEEQRIRDRMTVDIDDDSHLFFAQLHRQGEEGRQA